MWGWRPDTPSLISCALPPPPGQQPIHLGLRLSSPAEASLLSVKMSLAHADWSYLSFGGSLCGHHSAGRPSSPLRPPECKPPPRSFPPPPGGAQPRPAAGWICLSQQNLWPLFPWCCGPAAWKQFFQTGAESGFNNSGNWGTVKGKLPQVPTSWHGGRGEARREPAQSRRHRV